MKKMALLLSFCSSFAWAQGPADSTQSETVGGVECLPCRAAAMKSQENQLQELKNILNVSFGARSAEAQEIIRDEAHRLNQAERTRVGPKVDLFREDNHFVIDVDNINDLDEHTASELADLLRIQGLRDGGAIDFRVHQQIDRADQVMAQNRLRRALKVTFAKELGALSENMKSAVGFSTKNQTSADRNEKGIKLSGEVVNAVRLSSDSIRVNIYSSDDPEFSREIGLNKKAGEKAELDARFSGNINNKVYFVTAASVGQTDKGKKNAGVSAFITGKFDGNFRLSKSK